MKLERPAPPAQNASSDAAAASPDEPPVKRGLVFGIIAFALMMMSIDSTIVATALHAIQDSLDTSVNWAGWTITAYSLGFLLALPVSGKLNERYGHRKVFIGSIFLFTLASLLCGLSNRIEILVALRVLQAAGGAGFTPSATGIIVEHFGNERDRAVSLFGSIFPTGAMIGPIFGGLFVTWWSWRGIFLINLPIGLIVFIMAWRYIPRDKPHTLRRETMDFTGMLLLGCGIISSMFAASYLGDENSRVISWMFVLPTLLAIVSIWLFFNHINRSKVPFIEPRLIYGRDFIAINVLNILYGGLGSAAITLLPIYAINRYGIGVLSSGTLLIAQGLASIVLSTVGAIAIRRTGYRLPFYIGGVITLLGLFLLAPRPPFGISPYVWLAGTAFFIGTGRGIMNPASRNAGLQLVPERASTIAALRSMTLQMGGITTISVATAIIASHENPGDAQALVYFVAGLILLAMLPLIRHLPEHRGTW